MYLPSKVPVSHPNVTSLLKFVNNFHKALDEGGPELSPIEIFREGIIDIREIER